MSLHMVFAMPGVRTMPVMGPDWRKRIPPLDGRRPGRRLDALARGGEG